MVQRTAATPRRRQKVVVRSLVPGRQWTLVALHRTSTRRVPPAACVSVADSGRSQRMRFRQVCHFDQTTLWPGPPPWRPAPHRARPPWRQVPARSSPDARPLPGAKTWGAAVPGKTREQMRTEAEPDGLAWGSRAPATGLAFRWSERPPTASPLVTAPRPGSYFTALDRRIYFGLRVAL